MSLRDTIREKEKKKNHFIWNGVEVFIKDPIENEKVSVKSVLSIISEKVPHHLLRNVDSIYVGEFDFLKDRDIQAMYENSSIFVTNHQSNHEDMADDIVHEIAHSVEDMHGDLIYGDGKLEREFLIKRQQLYSIMKSEDLPADLGSFVECDYKKDFDEYLYKEVGYPTLSMVSSNIFYSPYAITSLKEYFANGFEAFFFYGDYDFVKKVCPNLFAKLISLLEEDHDQSY